MDLTGLPKIIIEGEEINPICVFYETVYTGLKKSDEYKELCYLPEELEKVLQKLRIEFKKSLRDEKSDEVKSHKIELDLLSGTVLLHIFNRAFMYIENIKQIDTKILKDEILITEINKSINFFEENKEITKNLIIKLTKELYYNLEGMDMLDYYFDTKIAEYPIEIENDDGIYTLTLNNIYVGVLNVSLSLIDGLFAYKDKYKYAEMFYNCQFIHLNDYALIRKKIKNKKIGDKIKFSVSEVVILYMTLNIASRYFVSDAVEIYEDIVKTNELNKEKKIGIKELRKAILQMSKIVMDVIKNEISDNEDFNREIKRIESWPIDID